MRTNTDMEHMWRGGLALALWLGGCDARHALAVDVQTDLEPGVDFVLCRATLVGDTDAGPSGIREWAEDGQRWSQGERIGWFPGLAPGEHWVYVELITLNGEVAAERRILVDVAADEVVTALLTVSCLDVTCPGDGDPPMATACQGGACVLPECTPDHPEACPEPQCTTDAECEGGAQCGEGTCAATVCWFSPGPDACAEGLHCRPDIGCAVCDDRGCRPAP